MGKSDYTRRASFGVSGWGRAAESSSWMGIHMQTLRSRIMYQNRWMTVREDDIRRPDGSSGIFGVVEKLDAALVIPVENGRVHMVQQFKYAVGACFWEFPQGTWEQAKNYSIEELARGELREETGLVATHLELLARIYIAYGFLTQPLYVFVATGLAQLDAHPEREEQDIVRGLFTWDEHYKMVEGGQVTDSHTLAALSLLRLKRPELAG
ncbi:MAG: NUDIX hydrolase [Candidatus Korobacteraceae bacterium]|jgi:ADP-ribose pyrophosphatase